MDEKILHVDEYLVRGCLRCELGDTPACKVHTFKDELVTLRQILLDSELKEEIKWSVPTYTLDHKNVVILSAFKNFCSLSFFKGSLMSDPHHWLVKPGPNSHHAMRIEFGPNDDRLNQTESIAQYIKEAIEVERSGQSVETESKKEDFPIELIEIFRAQPDLQKAFQDLTPGRQRGYLLYFKAAKQSATRIRRIEKWIPSILDGKGMHDR